MRAWDCSALPGCHKGTEAAAPAKDEAAKEGSAAPAGEGVTLPAEQVTKLGIATEPAKTADYTAEIAGYGVVFPHDAIAAAVAELTTAQAAQEQSRAAAARAQRLAGTPGAMSADAVETAARQVATDTAAVVLAERRLSSVIGAGPAGEHRCGTAGSGEREGQVAARLIPFGCPAGDHSGQPARRPSRNEFVRRVAEPRMDVCIRSGTHPPMRVCRDAVSLPCSTAGDAGEGERLLVWAPGTGPAQRGVTIPAAALVISAGKYWCYVEQKPGTYVRREVPTDRPLGDGYLVTQGIAAGEKAGHCRGRPAAGP